jgi:uncharacterized membrane protein YphA (DoxX/SURF4 family)
MTLSALAARPMLAGMFIYGGLDALRQPETKVAAATNVTAPLEQVAGTSLDSKQLIRANGAVQVAAGSTLALGIFPRVSALVLGATLVPTTLAGHRFWEQPDDGARAQQTIQFLKNVAMFGGLLFAAADTGGRPSLPWRVKRTAGSAAHRIHEALPPPLSTSS